MVSIVQFLEFVSTNKTALVVTTATLCEIIVIVINTIKKLMAKDNKNVFLQHTKSKSSTFLWVINPLNLLKRP